MYNKKEFGIYLNFVCQYFKCFSEIKYTVKYSIMTQVNTISREQLLIKDLKQSSKQAFDEIYCIYARRLLGYSCQYTKNMEDAEEIVQDVFVQLWNCRERIRQEESLKSLLFIMAKHRLINAFKARVNSPLYEDYVNCQYELSTNHTAEHIEYQDFLSEVKNAIETLPMTQRRIIKLCKFKGLTNKEVAQELSLSEQTVKNQLSLGLKALRQELDKVLLLIELLFLIG